MKWIVSTVFALLIAIAASNVYTALQRSYQKRTMADMRDAALRIEEGKPAGAVVDAWGHPMQVRVREGHYSIRAAMRDGKFERETLTGFTSSWDDDVVLSDGAFQRMPEGL